MTYSVAIPTPLHEAALRHLLRPDQQEDLCFALWNPSQGRGRYTACVEQIVLPCEGERIVRGNVSFTPEYFARALSLARQANCGLALLHSHLGPGWQGMSSDDVSAEEGHAPGVLGATGLPFVGLTAGTDGAWSARFWRKVAPRRFERQWCESVRVAGGRMQITYDANQRPVPNLRPRLARTVSAWGKSAQADLMRLRVGVIGTGSVGAIIAEALARMGIVHVRLMDFDLVENVNLDRLLHATESDAEALTLKVDMLARALRRSATAESFQVDALDLSVVEEDGFRMALDCDVLFSCVDRPWPRFVLNLIAYAHLIPVVDGGLALTPLSGDRGLKRGTWRAHVAAPTRRCLECLGQYDPGFVAMERMGQLDNSTYIEGLPADHELRQNQNVFGLSLSVAALELEQFLRMVITHPGHANIGAQTAHFVRGAIDHDLRGCDAHCPFCAMVGKGDQAGVTDFTGFHHAAARVRERRRASVASLPRQGFGPRVRFALSRFLGRLRAHLRPRRKSSVASS
jgi:molybdopterin-synthase adenylyltransferase